MKLIARIVILVIATLFGPTIGSAQQYFSEQDILRVSPRANPALVRALVDGQAGLRDGGINSKMRVAHFLAQVMTETGGLARLDENMNYSAATLIKVFSRKVISVAKANEIQRQPMVIANWVYGNRLGNRGRDTSDGWNYRGSGYIQLTGRDNFLRRGQEIDMPLVDEYDRARDPGAGLQVAIAYWKARKINAAADLNDRRQVRVLVNGPAAHGYDASVVWFNLIWTRVFRDKPDFGTELAWIEGSEVVTAADSIAAIAGILTDDGFLPGGAVESDPGSAAFSDAISAFQQSREIPVTGVVDEATIYAITDPVEWRSLEAEEFAAAPVLEPDGSDSFTLVAPVNPEATPIFEPNEGTGGATTQQLDADESASLSTASETYSEYELAEGVYVGSKFIPFTVIGEDNRSPVMDTSAFPARAIVQILFEVPGHAGTNLCSGAMISPDTVLTAGHCVHSGTADGSWYRNFTVYPGRNTVLKPFGACKGVQTFALRGWTGASTNDEARYFDMGAIKLDCAVGDATGWFGLRALGDEELAAPTRVQGYAGDKPPTGRQWFSTDQVRVIETLKVFYQNDTAGGTSGAPVFEEGDFRVFCVHTNGLHGAPPWRDNNACTRLTPDRIATIAGWITP